MWILILVEQSIYWSVENKLKQIQISSFLEPS